MHVLMRVDMVEHEAGGAKRLELGADFRREPAPRSGHQKEPQAGAQLMVIELAIPTHQSAEPLRRQYRAAVDQHEVEADAQ